MNTIVRRTTSQQHLTFFFELEGEQVSDSLEWLVRKKGEGLRVGESEELLGNRGTVFVRRTGLTKLEVTSNRPELFVQAIVPHWGPPLWKELHEAAWAGKLDEDFLYAFDLRIPNFCACRNHWKKIRFDFPLVEDVKRWSVDVHNAIRKLLHQSQFTYEEANQIYAKS